MGWDLHLHSDYWSKITCERRETWKFLPIEVWAALDSTHT